MQTGSSCSLFTADSRERWDEREKKGRVLGNIEKRGGSEQRERWKSFRLQNIPTLMQQPAQLQVTPQISDFE